MDQAYSKSYLQCLAHTNNKNDDETFTKNEYKKLYYKLFIKFFYLFISRVEKFFNALVFLRMKADPIRNFNFTMFLPELLFHNVSPNAWKRTKRVSLYIHIL